MQLHRELNLLDESVGQFAGIRRSHNAGHILDGDGIGAHIRLLLGEFNESVDGVHRRDGVADGALGVAAVFLDGGDSLFEIARIVERIEAAEDVHAVFAGQSDKAFDHIVWIVLVAQEVLSAQKHLQRGFFADRLDLAQTLPGILAQETHADIERCSAPALERIIAGIIDFLGNGQNVIGTKARSPE